MSLSPLLSTNLLTQPLDLRRRPIGPPIPIQNNAFTAPLHPFAPASYLITSD